MKPKPCPFCGCNHYNLRVEPGRIMCSLCGATARIECDEGDWNRRPVEERLAAALKALLSACSGYSGGRWDDARAALRDAGYGEGV